MNIFTRFLAQWSSDRPLHAFIEQWDALEALVVRTYRTGQVSPEDEALYARARPALLSMYDRWVVDLRPFWQNSRVGGKLEHADPFIFLIQHERAADFIDNWPAMQHLPAAREALNGLIVAFTGES